ncbi:alpha/beta hydrolase [Francisella sp. Scap27]|uniref:alpha/beta fold hydrolase n=1 Tax=Francisella sp. Scap27 TaxID=2589986 RepID=UPI0015C08455|nr:alpha/beta hydrolase [Francisella sp. Scap27]QLE78792.1 alpha/beta hydrolase [Francisella sp. Scap27]
MKSIKLKNGHLYYQECGSGPAMLWIHGLPLNSNSWFAQFEYFKSNYHNVAIDLRGYGNSSALPDNFDSITDLYMADIKQSIESLNLDKPILVGFASGGHVALKFAAQYGQLISKLIVINASPCFKKQSDWQWGFSAETLKSFTKKIEETTSNEELSDVLYTPAIKEQHSDELDKMKSWFDEMLAKAKKETILAFFNNIALDDDRKLLSDITTPTLIINGILGEEVPTDVGLYLRQNIANSQYYEINGVGHFVFATQSKLVNQTIEQFIDPSTSINIPKFTKEY